MVLLCDIVGNGLRLSISVTNCNACSSCLKHLYIVFRVSKSYNFMSQDSQEFSNLRETNALVDDDVL